MHENCEKTCDKYFSFKLACVDDADEKMHYANLLEMPLKRPVWVG